jgi:hypothetical protein
MENPATETGIRTNALIESLEATHKMFTNFVAEWERLEKILVTPEAKGEARGQAAAYRLAASTISGHISCAKIR